MASGYQVDGDDFENLCAPKGPFAGANVVGFSGISTLFAAREDYQYMRDPFPRGRYFDKGIDLAGLLCKKGYKPTLTLRWSHTGTEGYGSTLYFYIYKPTTTSLYVTNSAGTHLFSGETDSNMIFFRISGGGGGGGSSSWFVDGAGGGGAGCAVGWVEVPVTNTFTEGVYVVLGARGTGSTLTATSGKKIYCDRGGEASGTTPAGGGLIAINGGAATASGSYISPDFAVEGKAGGTGVTSGGTAPGVSVSLPVYSGGSVAINSKAFNNGSDSGGAGGGSLGDASGYEAGYNGCGGCGAYNGAGNSSTWRYGSSGGFELYY